MKRIYRTDWLASKPVFYNQKTGLVSNNINDVIDFANFEFHPEGLNNYLDFGYSVFEQTPIKDVKFLRHAAKLTIHDSKKIEVEYLDDPIEDWVGRESHEDDVLHLLQKSIQNWEKSVEGEIIIPTSGGYDSRILNYFIKDKSRIRAFTYGVSENQHHSFEVIFAKKLTEILQIRWEQIPLGNYHQYFNDWDDLFGISTHAHGMYHIEFYRKILSQVNGNNPFLSGIIGDAWAGSINKILLESPKELFKLGYSHGMRADFRKSKLKSDYALREEFWAENRDKINSDFYQIFFIVRFKIILLSYLISLPQYFGFKVWSPFLEPEIALSMVTLPSSLRNRRIWQKTFFQEQGLELEAMNLAASRQNNLNHQAMRKIPVQPLNVELLSEIIDPSYIEWINKCVAQQGYCWDKFWQISKVPVFRSIMYRLGVQERRKEAYFAYLTLKPIESLLKKREVCR